jgi:hypothetical protein
LDDWRSAPCLEVSLRADSDAAGADEEAEASEDEACARAGEGFKLGTIAKPTQNSRLQALGKPYRMHASSGKSWRH